MKKRDTTLGKLYEIEKGYCQVHFDEPTRWTINFDIMANAILPVCTFALRACHTMAKNR